VGVEVVVAERLQAGEHLVDLGFLADEGIQGCFLVPARLLGAEFVARGGDRVQAAWSSSWLLG
jgi:hypothetical protein